MAEKILRLFMYGVGTELGHIVDGDSVTLEYSDPTDEDPIEWVNVHVISGAAPVWSETRTYDEASDNEPGPVYTDRQMVPEGSLVLDPNDVTVEQLKDIARDKDLPVGGTKAELIERLNEDALDEVAPEAEGGPAAEAEEEASYDEWTKDELVDALRSRGLMVSGTKAELVERLQGNDELLDEG